MFCFIYKRKRVIYMKRKTTKKSHDTKNTKNTKNTNKSKKTKRNRKHQATKDMTCHPAHEKRKNKVPGTCYTIDAIQDIREAYNKHHKDKIAETDPKEIANQLRKKLDKRCSQEDCWLEEIQDGEKRRQWNEILFAPDRPKEWEKAPTTWLSNYDIADVLRQYEVAYPEFKLLGPSAIDYDYKEEKGGTCVWEELCRLSLKEVLQHGKTKLGVIFNLDKHDGPGTHWVAMFIDLEENMILYYDSAANPEPQEVTRLKNEVITQAKQLQPPKKMKLFKNSIAHQSSNTECGMFCLFFIITCLTRKLDPPIKTMLHTPDKIDNQSLLRIFTKPGVNDTMMMEYRQIYFNQP